MLYPIVLDPAFLNKIKDNEDYKKKIQDFIKEYKTFLSDFFILVDDNKKSLDKEYDKIIKEGEQNILGSIIASEFKKLKRSGKSISIKTSNNSSPVKNILDTLKNNNINKIVEFPKFFEENFITTKKNVSKQHVVNMKYDEFMEKIISITRFSKKIYFIDPMIPYDLLSLNIEERKNKFASILNVTSFDKQNSSDYKIRSSKKKGKMYSFSLNEIIKKIHENNLFKDELDITIFTTISPAKIKNLVKSIKTSEERDVWFNLHNILIECIKKQTKFPVKVIVKEHFRRDNSKKGTVYDRAIYAIDIDAGLEVRKGLDILDPDSSNNLKNDSDYFLKMCISDDEKDMLLGVLKHELYKPHLRKN